MRPKVRKIDTQKGERTPSICWTCAKAYKSEKGCEWFRSKEKIWEEALLVEFREKPGKLKGYRVVKCRHYTPS